MRWCISVPELRRGTQFRGNINKRQSVMAVLNFSLSQAPLLGVCRQFLTGLLGD